MEQHAAALVRRAGGVLVTPIDVTAQVTARALEPQRARLAGALAQERERLRGLIRQIPAPVALQQGPEHRFALVNDAARRIVVGGRDITVPRPHEAIPDVVKLGIVARRGGGGPRPARRRARRDGRRAPRWTATGRSSR